MRTDLLIDAVFGRTGAFLLGTRGTGLGLGIAGRGIVGAEFQITADGQAAAVELEKGSGFERLDEAAKQAVARWRFVPAKRGDEAIEASVIVPIVFRLDN